MRLVAVLAFTAWGSAQLFPDSAAAGALNDLAILLFVLDAAVVVISDARTLRQPRGLSHYSRTGRLLSGSCCLSRGGTETGSAGRRRTREPTRRWR
jgi:hypothetical protein